MHDEIANLLTEAQIEDADFEDLDSQESDEIADILGIPFDYGAEDFAEPADREKALSLSDPFELMPWGDSSEPLAPAGQEKPPTKASGKGWLVAALALLMMASGGSS